MSRPDHHAVNATRIHVTIGRLVLRGIAPGDRAHLIAALQAELSHVLSDPQTRASWARSGRTPVLRLGKIPFEPGPAGSRKLGRKIAEAIARCGVTPAGRISP